MIWSKTIWWCINCTTEISSTWWRLVVKKFVNYCQSSFPHKSYNYDDPLQSQGNSLSAPSELCTVSFLLKTTSNKTLSTHSNYLIPSKPPLSSSFEVLHASSLKVQLSPRIHCHFLLYVSVNSTFPRLSC